MPPSKTFLIKHYSGMCVAVDAKSNQLILTSSCDQTFILTSGQNLKHFDSGKCAVPERNDSFIKLDEDCSSNKSKFIQTDKYSVKHFATGKCFHPNGDQSRPTPGTKIVLNRGCSENTLQFKFINGKIILYYNYW